MFGLVSVLTPGTFTGTIAIVAGHAVDVNPQLGETAVTPIRLGGVVTLRDVARVARVSVSTASRVLDERLPASRSAAAERVRVAAAELGYVRDPLASAMRRSGTSTIGVIVPRLTDTVMAMPVSYTHLTLPTKA